jgi:hypothetical protein
VIASRTLAQRSSGVLASWSVADHRDPYEASPFGFTAVAGASMALAESDVADGSNAYTFLDVLPAESASAVATADLAFTAPTDKPWMAHLLFQLKTPAGHTGGFDATATKPGDAELWLEILDTDGGILAKVGFLGEGAIDGNGNQVPNGRVKLVNSNGDVLSFDGGTFPTAGTQLYNVATLMIYVDPTKNQVWAAVSNQNFARLAGTNAYYAAGTVERHYAPVGWNWSTEGGVYNPPTDAICLTWRKAGDKAAVTARVLAKSASDAAAGHFSVSAGVQALQIAEARATVLAMGDSILNGAVGEYTRLRFPDGRSVVPVTYGGVASESIMIGHQVDFWRTKFGTVLYAVGANDFTPWTTTYQADLDAKLARAQAAGHRIILATCFSFSDATQTHAHIADINASVRTLAAKYNVPCVPVAEAFLRNEFGTAALGCMDRREPWMSGGQKCRTYEAPAIWAAGGEANDNGMSEFDAVTTAAGGSFTTITGYRYQGTYGFQWSGTTDAKQAYADKLFGGTGPFEFSLMFYCHPVSLADGITTDIFTVYKNALGTGGAALGGMQINRTGNVHTIKSLAGTTLATIFPGQWYRLAVGRDTTGLIYHMVGIGGYKAKSALVDSSPLAGVRIGKQTVAANSAIAGGLWFDNAKLVASFPWADWWADVHPTGVAALMYLAMLQAAIAASVPWPGKVG